MGGGPVATRAPPWAAAAAILCGPCGREIETAARPRRLAAWERGAAWGLAPYTGRLRRAVKRLKYGGYRDLGPLLGGLLAERLRAPGLAAPDAVTFVPLHWRRRLARGYNQAELLARGAAAAWSVPCRPTLVKARALPSQVGRPRAERRRLPGDAFRAFDPASVRDRSWLLIDDVWTTGTTARACVAALAAAGAARVTVATVAWAGRGREPRSE